MSQKLMIFVCILLLASAFRLADPLSDSINRGKDVYTTNCVACHQADGKGIAKVFPPLAKSDYLMADKERSIAQVLYGADKEMVVNGETYNVPMLGFSALSDQEIADVLNYVRNTWGNKGKIVTAEEVAKERKKKKK
ncbi:MAG: cytochrome c [Saprospiraceae bacterium]|nr:cytochrome c [Saprospiraceae bacterium]